ncbi:glycoside hydrolase family 71/99-like protein [Marinoscillum sp.]|uniref:glycoside hydrolase family 71/99-like protein n=1 Tax=Marinoscillum sp. TaxID=2024838 RepID=UPI003BABC9EC
MDLINWIVGIAMFISLGLGGCKESDPALDDGQSYIPVMVEKSNATRLYMHYMPWFESKDFSGYWGSHWRMANSNPDNIDGQGKRDIAAHYYPLIGPYDSADPDLVEYHLLLMKYAGIDGVLIDWYGTHKTLDYYRNFENTEALVTRLDTIGLSFGVVYEEYTAEAVATRKGITEIEAAQADLTFLEENYFSREQYIKQEENPLLLTFGPRLFRKADDWTEIFSVLESKPDFMPLWGHDYYVGDNGIGEFSWVDFNADMRDLTNFYSTYDGHIIGSACPGFDDYYQEGGWGEGYGYLSHRGGATFSDQLAKAAEFSLGTIQLVTWNDFGEGTMIEPTDEFQYQFLEILQEFSGVSYSKSELDLVCQYYLKRKEYRDNTEVQQLLDEVFTHLNELRPEEASAILEKL